MVGLCPFHSEKTPSFNVYPENGSFYCFGCGAGGDVITFVRRIENLDYMEEALFEVYRKLRPSEPPTIESAQSHINGLFFDARRYDLSRVGRYKYNKKLNLTGRITGQKLSRPIINPLTGELMAETGEIISHETSG